MSSQDPTFLNRVQMLAASPRPLADVLVDSLRRDTRRSLGNYSAHADEDRTPHQFSLRLDDFEPDVGMANDEIPALRPVEFAAAIQLGRALDGHRQELAKLQDSDAVTVFDVPNAGLAGHIDRLLRHHVIGRANILDGSELRSGRPSIVTPGTVAIFGDPDDEKSIKSERGDADLTTAVQRRCAIVGVSAEPDRLLPRDLVRLAETRIVVPQLDGAAIAAVIEAVTGRHPGAVDDALAARTTVDALNLAIRADLGAEGSLARLKRLLAGCVQDAVTGPLLSEMHGLGAAQQWGLDLVADLRAYAAGALPWSACPKGLLLTSRPGTGKTSFARALAREAGVHFISTSYAGWQSHKDGHLGHVTQAIRKTFAQANQHKPCIVFIDEIDTLPARGSTKRDNDWWTAIINVMLECLDGYEKREGVVVIGACNDPSRLDPALVRPGRLDRRIDIPLPDLAGLTGIFRTYLSDDLVDADIRPVALAARGGTGANVEFWVREARGRARRKGKDLTVDLLLDAVYGGAPALPAAVRNGIAHHEAGHAIASLVLGVGAPIALSIDAGGGFAESEPGETRSQTRAHLEHYLVVLLAGRAAEELVFGDPTAGAGGNEESDLAKATLLATRIETSYGLGRSGLLWIPAEQTNDLVINRDLQQAVRSTLDRAYIAAKELLSAHRASFTALAAALLSRGYLDRVEIDAILAQTPLSVMETLAGPPVQGVGISTVPGVENAESSSDDSEHSPPAALADP